MICAPGLLKLQEYDREHNTELYRTLFVYLKNNLRVVHAARELFIHRSTFLYRLERIQKITGLSIENDDQWYLLLSFKLLASPCQSESRS
jgi:DNA-binding PucR family transcriptional regulator